MYMYNVYNITHCSSVLNWDLEDETVPEPSSSSSSDDNDDGDDGVGSRRGGEGRGGGGESTNIFTRPPEVKKRSEPLDNDKSKRLVFKVDDIEMYISSNINQDEYFVMM
jgi:hypothetical protein